MRIDTVHLRCYKGFKDVVFPFDGKSTVLFGINGVGKSSVLEAINVLYARIINRITQNKFKQIDHLDANDIMFGESYTQVTMNWHIGDSGHSRQEYRYWRKMVKSSASRTHDRKSLDQFVSDFRDAYIEQNCDMPIFANYGPHRAVHVVPVRRIRVKHEFDKISAFDKAIVNVIDFRAFFEWFRERQEIESDIKVNLKPTYVDIPLKSAKRAILSMLDGFTDVRIMFNPLRMVATKSGGNLMIEQLSDGEKCTLAMIGDLARRLALANPGSDNPLTGYGVVLIDELELHLHPIWQARILGTLMDTFPNIQFIVTTHSPKVLGELGGNVNVFEMSFEDGVTSFEAIAPLNGWHVGHILQNHMGTHPYNLDTQGKLDKIFSLIQSGDFTEAEAQLSAFEESTSSLHPEVVKARILLRRGRRKHDTGQ